jgi:MFS family permease
MNNHFFRRFFTYRFGLIMALNMQTTIISYMLYQITHDELSLGILGLAEVIPAIGVSFFSGHFVDNKEKRNLLKNILFGYLLLTAFFILVATKQFQVANSISTLSLCIYFGVFVGGALRAFLSPASFALLGMIVPREHYTNATTWSSTAWQLGAVLGPLAGGAMIAVSGYQFSLMSVLVLEIVAFAAVLLIPRQTVQPKEKEPFFSSLKKGIQFVFNTKIILAALALDMFAVLFGGAVALLPVYATDILKVGEVGFGFLRAAPGIGSIIMLVLLAFYPLKVKPGIKMLVSIALFGMVTIIFGVSTNFYLSFLMLLLGGLFDAVSVVIRGTILQLNTPEDMRGRVAAVNTMFISSSNELGALESGVTAKWMGTKTAVVFGGMMTLVVVLITYLKTPVLKTLQLDATSKDKT